MYYVVIEELRYPVDGIDYPETFQELDDWFSSDDVSLDYIAKLRRPKGYCCPSCENKVENPSSMGCCLFFCRNGMVIIGSETLRYSHIVTNISGRGDLAHAVRPLITYELKLKKPSCYFLGSLAMFHSDIFYSLTVPSVG
jgi:hypothetical protein